MTGKLIYLSHTSPDIAFIVSVISQFMHVPGPTHFEVIFRIVIFERNSRKWVDVQKQRAYTSGSLHIC